MFKYFPANYVWNLSVDLAIEMGARIGEIEEMCAPLQDAAKQPDAAGVQAFRETWFRTGDKLIELAREDEARGRLLSLLLPRPWSKRRAVLIGDAVHATTPHLAAGACIGLEDALVLAEEIARADVAEALAAFQAQRWERCRMVVENSLRLAEIETTGGDQGEHAALMAKSMMALGGPI